MEEFESDIKSTSRDESQPPLSGPQAKVLPIGILFCALAALFYTGANAAMTVLGRIGTSELWLVGIKETVTVLSLAPMALLLWIRQPNTRPDRLTWSMLIAAGLMTQLLGNIGYAYSLKVIGMAATIPIISASILVSTAFLGRLLLNERVSIRSTLSIAMLIVAICFISGGSGRAAEPTKGTYLLPAYRSVAILMSIVAGLCFGFLTIAIRHAMNRSVPKPVVMTTITAAGFFLLVPAALYRDGLALITTTTGTEWAWMLGAGLFNLVAFYCLNKGLQLTRAVHANITTSSQIAMAALLGLILFHEPFTAWLAIGVLLTVAGVLLIDTEEAEIL